MPRPSRLGLNPDVSRSSVGQFFLNPALQQCHGFAAILRKKQSEPSASSRSCVDQAISGSSSASRSRTVPDISAPADDLTEAAYFAVSMRILIIFRWLDQRLTLISVNRLPNGEASFCSLRAKGGSSA